MLSVTDILCLPQTVFALLRQSVSVRKTLLNVLGGHLDSIIYDLCPDMSLRFEFVRQYTDRPEHVVQTWNLSRMHRSFPSKIHIFLVILSRTYAVSCNLLYCAIFGNLLWSNWRKMGVNWGLKMYIWGNKGNIEEQTVFLEYT